MPTPGKMRKIEKVNPHLKSANKIFKKLYQVIKVIWYDEGTYVKIDFCLMYLITKFMK